MSNNISRLLDTLLAYLNLIRLHRTAVNFLIPPVVVYLLAGWQGVSAHAKELSAIFVIFGVFLYGGIYTLNGLADVKDDSPDRPLVSGAISKQAAIFIAAFHVLISFILMKIYLPNFSVYWLLFLLYNIIYSFILKRFSGTLAVLSVPLTMVLRAMLGFDLVNLWGPNTILLLTSFYLMLAGIYERGYIRKPFLKKGANLKLGNALLILAALLTTGSYFATKNWLFLLIFIVAILLQVSWKITENKIPTY